MRNPKAGLLCIVLLMLLLSISTAYCQQASASDQQIIDNLSQLRMELLQKLVATIPVKFHFSMNEAAAVQNCNNKGGLRFCTYTFKTGEVLSETTNERGYLINDSFQDPSSHIVLNTEYTIYNRPICFTLIDTLEQVGIKVCNPCNNNTISISWTNQTILDYKTGESRYADTRQLALMAAALFLKYPEIEKIKTMLLFVVKKDHRKQDFSAEYGLSIFSELHGLLSALENAYQTDVWNPRPNGLCRRFCGVSDCPHNGGY